jgi:hypothetical protein
MAPELIEKFIQPKIASNKAVNIHFKDRGTVTGIFIQSRDYNDLKAKNFWRIVNEPNVQKWKETKDENLARIFNGASFTRLSEN